MATTINGDTGIDKVQDGSVVNADLATGIDAAKLTGTLPAIDGSALTGISSYADSDALSLFNVSGSAPVYASRAWVNFNGTGTVAIRASGNVSSITDNGTGNYTINFTTAMPDANYAAVATTHTSYTTGGEARIAATQDYQTGSVVVETGYGTFANQDEPIVNVVVFR